MTVKEKLMHLLDEYRLGLTKALDDIKKTQQTVHTSDSQNYYRGYHDSLCSSIASSHVLLNEMMRCMKRKPRKKTR